MPTDHTAPLQPGPKRCPVCWTWFTPNSPSNPHPRRYCCAACRIQDSRRRREAEQTQLLLDATIDAVRAANRADQERREAIRLRHPLDAQRRTRMDPD
jgi:hypothetical protein